MQRQKGFGVGAVEHQARALQQPGAAQHLLDGELHSAHVQCPAVGTGQGPQPAEALNAGDVDAVDRQCEQADVPYPGICRKMFRDALLQRSSGREIEFRIHPHAQQSGCEWGQLPQVAVAQAAVRVQPDLDDPRMQPLVEEVAQVQHQPRQHPPVHARRGREREEERQPADEGLHPGNAPQPQQHRRLDEAGDRCHHHRGEHRLRHVVERRREPQQYRQDQRQREQRGPAALRARVQVDRGARERRACRETATETRSHLRQAVRDQVLVLVPARAALLVLDLGRGGSLQEADEGDHQHGHQQLAELVPVQPARPVEVRQPGRQVAHHRAVLVRIAQGPAGQGRDAYDDDGRWKGGPPAARQDQQDQAAEPEGGRRAVEVVDGRGRGHRMPRGAQPQQRRQLRCEDEQRGGLGEPVEYGRRDEVEQPAEAHGAQQQLHQPRQDGHPGRQGHPFGAARFRHAGEGRPDQQGGERRGPDPEAGGRTPQHRDQRGHEGCVDARHQRHASQGRVGHALGHQHQPHRHAGPELSPQQLGVRPRPREKGEPAVEHALSAGCAGIRRRRGGRCGGHGEDSRLKRPTPA